MCLFSSTISARSLSTPLHPQLLHVQSMLVIAFVALIAVDATLVPASTEHQPVALVALLLVFLVAMFSWFRLAPALEEKRTRTKARDEWSRRQSSSSAILLQQQPLAVLASQHPRTLDSKLSAEEEATLQALYDLADTGTLDTLGTSGKRRTVR